MGGWEGKEGPLDGIKAKIHGTMYTVWVKRGRTVLHVSIYNSKRSSNGMMKADRRFISCLITSGT